MSHTKSGRSRLTISQGTAWIFQAPRWICIIDCIPKQRHDAHSSGARSHEQETLESEPWKAFPPESTTTIPGEPSILSSLRSLLCWYQTFILRKGCPCPIGTLVSCSLVGKGGPQKKTPEVTQDLRLVHDISDIITEYHKKVPI